MAEFNDRARARLRAQIAVNIRSCEAARRLNPSINISECLLRHLDRSQAQVIREYSPRGEYINPALNFLSNEYRLAINQQQQIQNAGKRHTKKRHTKKRRTKKRRTVKYARKSR
jgi:hypothetical protein